MEDSDEKIKELTKLNEKLSNYVVKASRNFDLFKFLINCGNDIESEANKTIRNKHFEFFGTVRNSVYLETLLILNNLLDIKSERGLYKYLRKTEQELKYIFPIYERKEIQKGIANQICQIDSKNNFVAHLKKRRDKIYAHFDKDYFYDVEKLYNETPLSFEDIYQLIKLCQEILNWHQQRGLVKCGTFIWGDNYAKHSLRIVMQSLRRYEKMQVYLQEHQPEIWLEIVKSA